MINSETLMLKPDSLTEWLTKNPPKDRLFLASGPKSNKKSAKKASNATGDATITQSTMQLELKLPKNSPFQKLHRALAEAVMLTSVYSANSIIISDNCKHYMELFAQCREDNLCFTVIDPVAILVASSSPHLLGNTDFEVSQTIEKCNWLCNTLLPSLMSYCNLNSRQPKKDLSLIFHQMAEFLNQNSSKWLVCLSGNKPSLADLFAFCIMRNFVTNPELYQENVSLLYTWFIRLNIEHIGANLPKPLEMTSQMQTAVKNIKKIVEIKNAPAKTEAQLQKEKKKMEKMAKFQAKENLKKNMSEKKKETKPQPSEKKTISEDQIKKKSVPNVSSCPMPDAYNPRYVEAKWYHWWETEGFFKPEYRPELMDAERENSFTLIIPPPNVTGKLHLGHALTNSVEDAITRWHRMNGKRTLWNPGCDHAGIATQVVVEKKIWREKQLTRHDLGRENFVKEVWKWKEEKGDNIYKQLRSLGSSCDWTRARFTLDEKMTRAVVESFVRLHDQGLIIRANRLVNWSCTLRSAISDIEVEKKELEGPTMLHVPGYDEMVEFGKLVSFAYKIIDSDSEIVVATTRIETMLGDTAVAVHPDDPRYQHLHGRFVQHPIVKDRKIPILKDDFVDKDFGTGAVKITPAHDPNDFEVGVRHNLPFLTIIDDEGKMSGDCGHYAGMKRFDARKALYEELDKMGLIRGTIPNPMVVPMCSRSKDVIEPLLKPQWYLKCQEMADEAMAAVRNGELKIIPNMHEKTWYAWLTDCRDWCISRQLWWGHQIPAYLVQRKGHPAPDYADNANWVSGRTKEEAVKRACEKFGVNNPDELILYQDEDVLDTWFSSMLFPFSIFDWPEETSDLKRFYPGSLLETGHDILFFWVARMVMIGLRLMGKLPFYEVYLHAMVRDAHGKKMSKSLGNAIDPIDVISGISLEDLQKQLEDGNLDPRELSRARAAQQADFPSGIPECGTDALRFALCSYTYQGRNINLDVLRVQGYRFFCNKLWNAARYALIYCLKEFSPPSDMTALHSAVKDTSLTSPVDRWILSRLSSTIAIVNNGFRSYDFPSATTALYNLWLYDFCDVYLEYTKSYVKDLSVKTPRVETIRHILYSCLEVGLMLIHPFMPFISEELYQRLPRRANVTNQPPKSISVSSYPKEENFPYQDPSLEEEMKFILATLRSIRTLRSSFQLTNRQVPNIILHVEDDATVAVYQPYRKDLLESLANCKVEDIIVRTDTNKPHGCVVSTVSTRCSVFLKRAGMIDEAKEIARLEVQQKKVVELSDKLKREVDSPDFQQKVPENVQEQKKKQLDEYVHELKHIEEALISLKEN